MQNKKKFFQVFEDFQFPFPFKDKPSKIPRLRISNLFVQFEFPIKKKF